MSNELLEQQASGGGSADMGVGSCCECKGRIADLESQLKEAIQRGDDYYRLANSISEEGRKTEMLLLMKIQELSKA